MKIFPAEFFAGLHQVAAQGSLPHVDFVPTGGDLENVKEFLKASTATAAGSSLVDAKSLKEKNWAAITAKAKAFADCVAAVAHPPGSVRRAGR